MKICFLILLITCVFINPIIAQKEVTTGSFVLVNGTRGEGDIEYKLADFYTRAKLVVKNSTGKIKYPIYDIQSFEINNHHYIRVENIPRRNKAIYDSGSHNDPIFLELLESGEIEIYRYGYIYQSGNSVSYLNVPVLRKRGTDRYLVLIPKKSVGFFDKKARNIEVVAALFPQSPDIQTQILNDKISQEELLNYIHQYNSSKN